MNADTGSSPKPSRRIACARCGASFGCTNDGSGRCWCGAEPFRLPVPLPAEAGSFDDCLCPACLRQVAASLAHLAPAADTAS